MTREEINKFLANTKVYVNGKSKEIQEKLFSFGYKWDSKDTKVDNVGIPFLFIFSNKLFSGNCSMTYFSNHGNREISAEDILSLEFIEHSLKEKFDPKTLNPFDKVITKCSCYPWKCDIFSHCVEREDKSIDCYCTSDDYVYDKCIPYNDETKHLVGTNKEAPEYYKYWEE